MLKLVLKHPQVVKILVCSYNDPLGVGWGHNVGFDFLHRNKWRKILKNILQKPFHQEGKEWC